MINYKGLTFITTDNVYLPAEDSFLAAEVLEEQINSSAKSGLSVLDMGTGSGILGLVAALSKKVKRVVFADINKEALSTCKENVAFNNNLIKAQFEVLESGLFSSISGNFDIIIFNAPYLRNEEDDKKTGDLAKAWAGGPEGIEASIEFLEGSLSHLNKDGKIILLASSLSNMEKLKSEMDRIGLKQEAEKKVHIFFEDIIAMVLVRKT